MDSQGKPLTQQAKDAMAAAGQKVGETWEATKATVSDVSSMYPTK
jgi:hypothetical protein